ncbi:MAG: hypothetical protein ABWY63_08300 [Hyphomicrobiaceae bacterium]
MKQFVEGAGRGQSTLLPECLDDGIDEDNPVRAIDAFVGALDWPASGFDEDVYRCPAGERPKYRYSSEEDGKELRYKTRMGASHGLMRTLPRIAAEMALHVLAYNLTRVMNNRRHQAVDRSHQGMNIPGSRTSAATKLSSTPAAAFLHDQEPKRSSPA